jgi:phage tail sheath gpL-like
VLAQMIKAWRDNDPSGEVWVLPIADAGSAMAATGTFTITGSATAAGTLPLYVGGMLVSVSVSTGDTAATVATNVATAINNAAAGVTATASSGVVTLTAVNKGTVGNGIDLRVAYRAPPADRRSPPVSGGDCCHGGRRNRSLPHLTSGCARRQDLRFHRIGPQQHDGARCSQGLLSDSSGRWSPMQQLYGHVFTAMAGTAGTLASAGVARNDQHLCIIGFNDSPTPFWVWAAGMIGAAAVSLRDDPARPLQYVAVSGILPPPIASRFPIGLRNSTLLYSGISTWIVDAGHNVVIENMITTYVTNAEGNSDNSYLEVETLFTLMYVLRFCATASRPNSAA